MIAQCLHGLTALAPGGGVPALMLALFVMGLAGGATHCSGMCAPFVLAQSAAVAGSPSDGRVLHRLSGAALLPYHLGRMLGYAVLGAVAGGTAGLFALATGASRPVLATLLALAALFMLVQGSSQLRAWLPLSVPTLHLPRVVQRWLASLLAAPLGWRGVLLGLLLSALPCGLLYGALAAAAAAGSALGGALAMAAFVVGTMPALIGVGLLGRLFSRRFLPSLRPVAAVLFLLNAAVLAGMAVRVAGI